METNKKGLMIEGVIWKELLFFSIPLLLGNLFQQLYNAVDSIIVGKYIGAQALAAVGSSAPIIHLLIGFFMGLSVGAGVVISRYFGAKKQEEMMQSIYTTLALAIISGIGLTFIGIALTPYILTWIGTPSDVMDNSILYLAIYFAGALGVMIYNMGSGILRALGDSKNPLYFLIISSVVNVILDIIFVIYMDLGIAGAGWATMISQCLSALLTILLLMHTKQPYRITLKKIRFHKEILKEIIHIGLPSGMQNAVVSFSNVIVQSNINAFGSIAMAGASCYTKIDGFAILPVMSFSMALTTFIGQNIGAEKYDRVKQGAKIGSLMSIGTIVVLSILIWIFAPQLISIFTDESDVVYYGILMMKCLMPGYICLSISHSLSGVLRGAGRTTVPMIIMISCWCIMRMAWIIGMTSLFNDIRIVFLGWPITWIASCIAIIWYYNKGNWLPQN